MAYSSGSFALHVYHGESVAGWDVSPNGKFFEIPEPYNRTYEERDFVSNIATVSGVDGNWAIGGHLILAKGGGAISSESGNRRTSALIFASAPKCITEKGVANSASLEYPDYAIGWWEYHQQGQLWAVSGVWTVDEDVAQPILRGTAVNGSTATSAFYAYFVLYGRSLTIVNDTENAIEVESELLGSATVAAGETKRLVKYAIATRENEEDDFVTAFYDETEWRAKAAKLAQGNASKVYQQKYVKGAKREDMDELEKGGKVRIRLVEDVWIAASGKSSEYKAGKVVEFAPCERIIISKVRTVDKMPLQEMKAVQSCAVGANPEGIKYKLHFYPNNRGPQTSGSQTIYYNSTVPSSTYNITQLSERKSVSFVYPVLTGSPVSPKTEVEGHRVTYSGDTWGLFVAKPNAELKVTWGAVGARTETTETVSETLENTSTDGTFPFFVNGQERAQINGAVQATPVNVRYTALVRGIDTRNRSIAFNFHPQNTEAATVAYRPILAQYTLTPWYCTTVKNNTKFLAKVTFAGLTGATVHEIEPGEELTIGAFTHYKELQLAEGLVVELVKMPETIEATAEEA